MKTLRVAIIGAGHLGKIHARLVQQIPGVELVGIADPSPLAQKECLQAHDVPVVSDVQKLVDHIDAAIIATPTRYHHSVALQLVSRSIHCLIEKPLTDNPQSANQLVELAEQHACVLSVGHVEQFNPAIRLAVERVGSPRFIQATRTSSYTYRSIDIGVVHDLMIHDIDLVNSLFPGDLVECRAVGTTVLGGWEDLAQARLEFSCGGVANLTASRVSFASKREFQLFGDRGFAMADLVDRTVTSVGIPDWVADNRFDFLAATPEQQSFVRDNLFTQVLPRCDTTTAPNNAILEEQRDWIQSIRTGKPLRNTARQGAEAVQIADQILQQIQRLQSPRSDVRETLPLQSAEPGQAFDTLPHPLRPAA